MDELSSGILGFKIDGSAMALCHCDLFFDFEPCLTCPIVSACLSI